MIFLASFLCDFQTLCTLREYTFMFNVPRWFRGYLLCTAHKVKAIVAIVYYLVSTNQTCCLHVLYTVASEFEGTDGQWKIPEAGGVMKIGQIIKSTKIENRNAFGNYI